MSKTIGSRPTVVALSKRSQLALICARPQVKGSCSGVNAAVRLEESLGLHKRWSKLMYSVFHSGKVACDRRMSLKETRSDDGSSPLLRPRGPGLIDRGPKDSHCGADGGPPAPKKLVDGTEERRRYYRLLLAWPGWHTTPLTLM